MRWSQTFIPTLKEDPQDAEAISHKLMVRAGLIRRLTSGAYIYLPLGYKVLKKAERIVREEMEKVGAIELLMPALQPIELWKKTGRYDVIGDVMIKFTDRHGREVALGPTHEEIITDLVSREIRSYKDLPRIFYQIQTKFRDEVRPRFGVVRSCEFVMKDAYSFDVDGQALENNYKKMYDAYCSIFERCGLNYIAVEADSGMMGGAGSHEFMVVSEIGEDKIVVCSECGYAASIEVAAAGAVESKEKKKSEKAEEIKTPGVSTVEAVSNFLKVAPEDLIKTLIYIADGQMLAVLVRGDFEVNEPKIKNALKIVQLELASEKKIEEVTGGPIGFSGPVGLKDVKIVADNSVKGKKGAVTGANKKDKHIINVEEGRDFKVEEWFDIRVITEKDPCPKCGGRIENKSAIEIGHTFKLGTKYSKALDAKFLDQNGKEKHVIMGCYGIGVNRIIASLIENNHDDKGIKWPASLCPYEVIVMPINKNDDMVLSQAEKIYSELKDKGIDVIIDDRDKSPGIKFKDADLIGIPIGVIVGKKSLDQGMVEVNMRNLGEKKLIEINQAVGAIMKTLREG